MSRLLRELFKGEFVIDEHRERIADVPMEQLASALAEPASRPKEDISRRDLLTQISAMLLEQERLERLASELRQLGDRSNAEQLARFFRMSLSVLDGFDRLNQTAMDLSPSEEVRNWLKSVATVSSRMTRLCESFGLRSMDPVGKTVNLNQHEVVEVIRTDSLPDETVVEVRQKGYTFNGRVLRDARVVVAKNERS